MLGRLFQGFPGRPGEDREDWQAGRQAGRQAGELECSWAGRDKIVCE